MLSSHKNPVVRKLAMQLICYGMEQIGDVQVLSLPRDTLEKLMLSITSTSQDNSPDARFYARKAITLVIENPEFDKRISKNLSPDLVSKVLDLVKLVQTKGVGELSSAGLQSARQSRIGQQPPTRQNQQSADTRIETSGSVKNSYALRQGTKGASGNIQAKPRKSQSTSQDTNHSLTVSILSEDVLTRLESKKWDERLDAIKEIHGLVIQHSSNISHDQRIVKAVEGYILRLTDSNSKVNIMAIECFLDVITVLGNKLVQHLHPIFKALTSNLASKNQTIKVKAKESLDTIITSIDHSYLVQPLSSVAQYANNIVRPVLLNSLADVSEALFDKKPGVVQKHVLPLIFSLLEHHLNAECSAALQNLCQIVYQYMNKSLFEKASRLSNSQQEKLRKLAS